VIPGAHRRGVFAFEHSATGENAQQTVAHLGLNLGDGFGTDAPGFMKAHAACASGLENAVDHNAVEMDVGIEQGAEAMDEGDGTDPGGWARPRAARAQALLHRTEKSPCTIMLSCLKQWCWNSIGVRNRVVRFPMPYSDMKSDDRSRHLASLMMTQA
jgi:hypothetical protein